MALHLLIWLGTEPTAAVHWLALLLTCSAHAVVWTGAAAWLVRRRSLSSSTRHLFWKMALFGPLVTTLLAAALPGGFERAAGDASHSREVSVLTLADARASTAPDAELQTGPSTAGNAFAEAPAWRMPGAPTWSWLIACGVGAAALGLLRFTTSLLLLRRSLRGRKKVRDARLLQRLERMRTRIGLRRVVLTESASIGSPLVIGSSEICVPKALRTALTNAELDTVLAHELAHIERRDGLWFPVAGLVQSVLWMQPLNHWVVSRFRQTAELACDDRAVELTGDPMVLARALVQVAAGALRTHRDAMVPTMARSASTLLPRVKRLTDAGSQAALHASPRGRRWGIAGFAVVGLATASLSVQVARARLPPPAPDAGASLARSPAAALDSAAEPPPGAAALNEEMADLLRREQQLEGRLEAARNLRGAQRADAQESVEEIELSQELRHVRAAQAWTEERFVHEWTTWETRHSSSAGAHR